MPSSKRAARDYLQREFDSHPSLAASLSDFSPDMPSFSPPDAGAHAHLARSSAVDRSDSELDSASDSAGPWSPPAWRRPGSGWYPPDASLHRRPSPVLERHHMPRQTSPLRNRHPSPDRAAKREDADEDDTFPASVPLPGSPLKRSPEPSPEPEERGIDKKSVVEAGEKDHIVAVEKAPSKGHDNCECNRNPRGSPRILRRNARANKR